MSVDKRCFLEGKPITVRRKVIPEKASPDGAKGKCPLCKAWVHLSLHGFITVHDVETPGRILDPGNSGRDTSLPEKMPDITDSASRTGSPHASEQLRAAEIDASYGRGEVQIPEKKGKRTELIWVPATLENLRVSLAYWQTRMDRADARDTRRGVTTATPRHRKQAALVADLRIRIAAHVGRGSADKGSYTRTTKGVVRQGPSFNASLEAVDNPGMGEGSRGMSPGPALFKGRAMASDPSAYDSSLKQYKPTDYGSLGRTRTDDAARTGMLVGHDPDMHAMCAEQRCRHIVWRRKGFCPRQWPVWAVEWREFSQMSRSARNRYWKRVQHCCEQEKAARQRARTVALPRGYRPAGKGGRAALWSHEYVSTGATGGPPAPGLPTADLNIIPAKNTSIRRRK